MKLADGTHPGNVLIADTRGSMSMSCPDDMKAFVAELLLSDTQGWARLLGLMSQLALPSRPVIEVEIAPDLWEPIDALSIDEGELVLSYGRGDNRQEFRFSRSEPIPPWRHGHRRRMIPTAESR